LFIPTHEVFEATESGPRFRDPELKVFHFIDDFCGSGDTGIRYSNEFINKLKKVNPSVEFRYHVLFAIESGLKRLRRKSAFDEVNAVIELDRSFKAFGPESRYFSPRIPELGKAFCREIARRYGKEINSSHPLGYKKGELLLGFNHNTPNNSLPIFWADSSTPKPWFPIFPRYRKQYGWSEESKS
jgi:hypothetical protein